MTMRGNRSGAATGAGVFIAIGLILLLVVAVGFFIVFDIVTIKGNQVGVQETWANGVLEEPLTPKTYIRWAGTTVTPYSVGLSVFTLEGEQAFQTQSSDRQDMHLSLKVQWRIDPAHVVNLHKTVGKGNSIEQTILLPVILRVVKDKATIQKAMDVYSGEGLVKLQQEIETTLADPKAELAKSGIIVTTFVLKNIALDPEYVKEIAATQIAIQKELRSVQEEKAAEAAAKVAKALAQADLNKKVVEAERDKQVAVLAAEAKSETAILQAEGEKKKTVLAAEGEKESGELKAASITAIGEATAKVETLKFTAFNAPGAETYAKIEVAKSMAVAFSGIKGYIPESMTIFSLGESFTKAVENAVKPTQGQAKQ